jgi:predicted dithiol-disulfide oxidoreductase (DUF899 family)
VFSHDDNNQVFRTYFVDGRGVEAFNSTWSILDITPLLRQEEWEDTARQPASDPCPPRRATATCRRGVLGAGP